MNDPLFEPIRIQGLELRNRICMPAMHLNMITNFEVTPRIVDFYRERAAGGVGLIMVGFATVDRLSGNRACIGAHRDDFIPGLRRLSQAIQAEGARAAVQLNHSGRYNLSRFLKKGEQPVAPSAVHCRLTRETPRVLSVSEIEGIVEAFGQAAARVRQAGFDAVEILAGTGYLISTFLSPLTNQRDDAYGGSFDGRVRFALEVLRSVRRHVGEEIPVIVRLNGNELMSGGTSRAELRIFAERLVEEGAGALCVNVGWHEARVPQVVGSVPAGAFAYLARGIRERVHVPVIASHRINDPGLARSMLRDGICDMVAMGRALIADPELPRKASQGRKEEVLRCVACGQGCFDRVFKLRPVECLCNPRAGYEGKRNIRPAQAPRKVMVIGGGPAGMAAAAAAAQRGHRVSLYEAAKRLGGQLLLAGRVPGREDFLLLARGLGVRLERVGVKLRLGQRVDAARVEEEGPDAVILATGARPLCPDLPGGDLPHVVQAWDVLAGRAETGHRVVVVGGGAVGVETALFLAAKGTPGARALEFLLLHRAEPLEELRELALRGSKDVLVVEMLEKLGTDLGKSIRWVLLKELELRGVKPRCSTRLLEVTEHGIQVQREGREPEEIPADTVVLALGAESHAPLKEQLERQGIETHVVGDAREVADAMAAIHQGFLVAAEV